MADINILNIQPHQVSRDMRGYSVFFYGEPKSGKTTIATIIAKTLDIKYKLLNAVTCNKKDIEAQKPKEDKFEHRQNDNRGQNQRNYNIQHEEFFLHNIFWIAYISGF